MVVELSFGNQTSLDDSDVELEDVLPIEPANPSWGYRDKVDLMLIARECKKSADELLDALDQLEVKGSRKKPQCFRVTLKIISKPERFDEMARRMARFSSQLNICLIGNLG